MSANAVGHLLTISARIAFRDARAEPLAAALKALFVVTLMIALALLAQDAARGLIVICGLLLGWMLCRNRMFKINQQVRLGWPATLAISRVQRFLLIWLQAVSPVLVLLAVTLLMAVLLGADAINLLLAYLAAFSAALVSALFLPDKAAQRYPDSRYRRTSPNHQAVFNLKPIEQDLHALVAARMRPGELAKALVPLLLILPNQFLLQTLILLIPTAAALLYGSFLLAALPVSIQTSKRWLSSAPITLAQCNAVYRRALWPRCLLIGLLMLPLLLVELGWLWGLSVVVFLITLLSMAVELLIRYGDDGYEFR